MIRYVSGRHWQGFTLIELISVLVILAILAGVGSQMLVKTVESYDKIQARSKIVSRGRLLIEQMARQLRLAVPNSVRVSSSGNCLEFLPAIAGANYAGILPDMNNGAAATTSMTTSVFDVTRGTPRYIYVGAATSDEVYSQGNPASGVAAGGFGGGPYTVINFASAHVFLRNSINSRVYIADSPIRFCLDGANLVSYTAYGLLTSGLTDLAPAGATRILMAHNVTAVGTGFHLSTGSEDRNAGIDISVNVALGSESVNLNEQVLLRNVP